MSEIRKIATIKSTEAPLTAEIEKKSNERPGSVIDELREEIAQVQSDVDLLEENKQDTLVSGVNIKTINEESILGEGNISIDFENDVVVRKYTRETISNVSFAIPEDDYNALMNAPSAIIVLAVTQMDAQLVFIPEIYNADSSEKVFKYSQNNSGIIYNYRLYLARISSEPRITIQTSQTPYVSTLNGYQGAVKLKTINEQSLLGNGDVEIKDDVPLLRDKVITEYTVQEIIDLDIGCEVPTQYSSRSFACVDRAGNYCVISIANFGTPSLSVRYYTSGGLNYYYSAYGNNYLTTKISNYPNKEFKSIPTGPSSTDPMFLRGKYINGSQSWNYTNLKTVNGQELAGEDDLHLIPRIDSMITEVSVQDIIDMNIGLEQPTSPGMHYFTLVDFSDNICSIVINNFGNVMISVYWTTIYGNFQHYSITGSDSYSTIIRNYPTKYPTRTVPIRAELTEEARHLKFLRGNYYHGVENWDYVDIKTINGQSLIGDGDISIEVEPLSVADVYDVFGQTAPEAVVVENSHSMITDVVAESGSLDLQNSSVVDGALHI